MRRLLSLLIGIVLFVGTGSAQLFDNNYERAQVGTNPFGGSSYSSFQPKGGNLFDSRLGQHLASPTNIQSTYVPMSTYSSTLSNPFSSEPNDEHIILKTPPEEGGTGTGVQDPLGDPILPLMLMLVAYAGWIIVKRRRQKL